MIYCYLFKVIKICNLKTQITRISAKYMHCLKAFIKCNKPVDQLMSRKVTIFIYLYKIWKICPI